jgi:hypothetical protein
MGVISRRSECSLFSKQKTPTGSENVDVLCLEGLVGRYSNNSDQGEILTRVLSKARESVRRDVELPQPHPPAHKVTQRLSPDEIARLVQSYEAGASTTQLEQEFGLGHGTVIRLLQKHGVKTRLKGLSESETAEARQLYESGLPLAEVSKRVGRAQSSVRKALIRAGVTMRPRGGSLPKNTTHS